MNKTYQSLFIAIFISFISVILISGQTTSASNSAQINAGLNYSLIIENEDGKQIKLTSADIAKLTHHPWAGDVTRLRIVKVSTATSSK